MFDLILIRTCFVLILSASAFFLRPFSLEGPTAALLGIALSAALILLEIRVKKLTLNRLVGAILGAVVGILVALLVSRVLEWVDAGQARNSISFIQTSALLLFAYVGLVVGAANGAKLNFDRLTGGGETPDRSFKILDTSVIIDGRIADIAETGFLDGTLVIPQFVLRELQMVADSADSMRRNRGRRGLDVLQRIQKMGHLDVRIIEEDFAQIREVDLKLIELAKAHRCKIVTNDFNLNKVAQVQGVSVLNINELANAMKPVVLPGESMRVFVLKEGKEYNQGVAYLDDGTMVVVDNAKRMISKTIDVTVTSVLQTTAGKMIFGRFDERQFATVAGAAERNERVARRTDGPVPEKSPVES